ncbi:MAG: hypothetical protein IPQ09_25695 [Myxococcales bacterium]|nr:hypothetical protein [Myxococcales bacterium]
MGTSLLDALLEAGDPGLARHLQGETKLTRVTYADRYVRSPLVARVVAEVVGALARRSGGIGSDTEVQLVTTPPRPRSDVRPHRVFHDWPDATDQRAALVALLAGVGRSRVTASAVQSTLHMRELRLEWPGSVYRVRLDQGFGFLRAVGRELGFDFRQDGASQARALWGMRFGVEAVEGQVGVAYLSAGTEDGASVQ